MKKIMIAIIATSLVLSMAACAKSDEVYGKATPDLMKKVIEEYRNKE